HPGSAAILIFFRWLLLFHLKKDDILAKYDRFIVTRSDFVWKCPHPPVEYMNENLIWVPQGEGYGGITDRHAVLSATTVEDYLNLVRPIIHEPLSLRARMSTRSDWNLEKYILAQLVERGYENKIASFPYVMYSVRELLG